MPQPDEPGLKIAVIGGGIAGIMAAYLLQRKNQVTVFEAADYLGGHAHPVAIDNGRDMPFEIDTAFLVFNNLTYPLFIKFIKELDAFKSVVPSMMSFSFCDYEKDLHFTAGRKLSTMFYQKKNLFNRNFYRMFYDMLRFRRNAYADLKNGRIGNATLAEYLAGYSDLFKENMIAPTAVSVWSLPEENIWNFPAATYIRFQKNHNYLKGMGWISSRWYTFNNSSGVYIKAFRESFKGIVNLNAPVKKVLRYADKVTLIKNDNSTEDFDRVVFATHANTTLKLIENPSELEKSLLGGWKYHSSEATLHTDNQVLHADKKLWESWNVNIRAGGSRVTYYLNRVQNLSSQTDYFLSLGDVSVRPGHLIGQYVYEHPVYDSAAIATQLELKNLNGCRNSYFCGSYFGFGFHEDAVRSSVEVAAKFGIEF